MIGRCRPLGAALSAGAGLFLIWLLFSSLSLSFGSALAVLFSAPVWLYAVVACCTLMNQVVGALKWRVAARYLARPVEEPGLDRMVELTCIGEFFGQLIPVQLSTLLARWFLLDEDARNSGYVARATIFEQGFDLIFVLAGSVAAVAVIGLGLPFPHALAATLSVLVLTALALRQCLLGGATLFRSMADHGFCVHASAPAAEGLSHAAAAPARLLLALSFYSLLRLFLVALRATAVFAFFAPQAASWLVFMASPVIALLTAMSIAPGGLGLAEWSWSAILILAGSAAPLAAIAALNLRLMNFIVLSLFITGIALRRASQGRRAQANEPGA